MSRVAGVAAGLSALLYVGLVDPERPGRYPVCPLRWATGLDCPGCGSLRAVHDLTRLDLLAAADHNLALLVALPFVLVAGARWLMRRPGPALLSARATGWVVLAGVVAWAILRNLPTAGLAVLGSA